MHTDESTYLHENFLNSIKNNDIETFKLFLNNKKIEPDYYYSNSLKIASQQGFNEILELLLIDGRADPTDYISECLRLAYQNNKIESINLLLKDGRVNPFIDQKSLIIYSIHKNHIELFQLLLSKKDSTFCYFEVLEYISQNNNIEFLKVILNNKEVNPVGYYNLPIYFAFKNKYFEICKLLWSDYRVKDTLNDDYPNLLKYFLQQDFKSKIAQF